MNKEIKTAEPTAKKSKARLALILCLSILLPIILGFCAYLIVDFALVDTPYDGIRLPKHIQLAKYMGAELSMTKVNEEYEKSKSELLAQMFTEKEPINTGKITEGQNVTITMVAYDYTNNVLGGKIDGVGMTAHEVPSIKKYDLNNLPKNEDIFFPELQNQLIGVDFNFTSSYITNMAPDLIYTYPEDYNVASVKGKQILHRIYIEGVSTDKVAEWNDALFADNKAKVNEFLGVTLNASTVKDFEDYMMEQIKLNLLWNSIADASKVLEYPEKKIKKYTTEFDDYYNALMDQNNWEFKDLLSQLGTDENGYINTRNTYAEGIVKEEMMLYEIVKAEKIRVSRSEYKAEMERLAAEAGSDVKTFEENYGKELSERTVLWEKVKKHLLANAVIVE